METETLKGFIVDTTDKAVAFVYAADTGKAPAPVFWCARKKIVDGEATYPGEVFAHGCMIACDPANHGRGNMVLRDGVPVEMEVDAAYLARFRR